MYVCISYDILHSPVHLCDYSYTVHVHACKLDDFIAVDDNILLELTELLDNSKD